MQLFFKKGRDRSWLTYTLPNSLSNTLDLNATFPYHDLAHYVVETQFALTKGFFGYLRAGISFQTLSTTAGINNLDPEIWLAEILTRNLQALYTGGVQLEQYIPLVEWELEQHPSIVCPVLDLTSIQNIAQTYQVLCTQWEALEEGEGLLLEF